MKYESFNNDCYNLYTIKTDKFRNAHMEVVFRCECTKESITYNALLYDVLMESNSLYPTRKLMAKKTQDLYSLSLYSVNTRVGETLLSNIVASFLDPKYMEEGTLEEIIKMIFAMIFKPNITENEFSEFEVEKCKNRLLNEIDSVKEDPKQNSILKSLKLLDENSPFSFNSSGYADILNSITPKKLYDYYLKMLENAYVDIYVIGNLDMEEINKLVKKYAEFNSIKTDNINIYLDDIKTNKMIKKHDKCDINQTQYVELYKLNGLDEYETNYVLPLWNMIWGSGSLDSKLYKSVRGDNGLCYNISSYYQKYDKLIIVHTAVDKDKVSTCSKLIKKSFDEMKKGNITIEELNNAKSILVNSLNLIYDSESRLVDNYLFKNLVGLPDVEERIDEFMKVSLDDLKKVTKKISKIMNYSLGA